MKGRAKEFTHPGDYQYTRKTIPCCLTKMYTKIKPGSNKDSVQALRHCYLINSKLSFSRISLEEAPIINSKSPGSAIHCNC